MCSERRNGESQMRNLTWPIPTTQEKFMLISDVQRKFPFLTYYGDGWYKDHAERPTRWVLVTTLDNGWLLVECFQQEVDPRKIAIDLMLQNLYPCCNSNANPKEHYPH